MTLGPIGSLFGNQQQPQQTGGTQPSQGENSAQNSPDAVEPSQGSSTENSSGQSTSYSGSGAGAGGDGAQSPTNSSTPPKSPAEAAPSSVVNAQVAMSPSPDQLQDRARAAALHVLMAQRTDALIEGLKVGPNPVPLAPQINEVNSSSTAPAPQVSNLNKVSAETR